MMNSIRKVSLVVVMSALVLGNVSAAAVTKVNYANADDRNDQAKIGYSSKTKDGFVAQRAAELAQLMPKLGSQDVTVLNFTEAKEEVKTEAPAVAPQANVLASEEVSNIAVNTAPQQSKCKRFVKAMIKPLIPVLVVLGATYVRVYLSRMNNELIPV